MIFTLATAPLRTKAAISHRFRTLLQRIEPGPASQRIYQAHSDSVRQRLKTVFATNTVFPIGSYERGSAIRLYSDLDLMLVLSMKEVRWGEGIKTSVTVLNEVRDQLQQRYRFTHVVRDWQAIVINFSDGEHPVDVVPAHFSRFLSGPVYKTPILRFPTAKAAG